MRKLSLLIASFAAFAVISCGTSSTSPSQTVGDQPPTETPAGETNPEDAEPYELFGEALDTSIEEVSFADITANPDSFAKKQVITRGTVRMACTKRGCWMEVRPTENRDGASATVRFKDYGFFVPLDSRGARVKMQATVAVKKLSAAEVEHLEEEGATIEKLPDGSAKVITIEASGVEMRGRKGAKK